jgi:hypothetical protein
MRRLLLEAGLLANAKQAVNTTTSTACQMSA